MDYANVAERREQPPALAVSTVIFALREDGNVGRKTLWLPLVRRTREPFKGRWALPGGPLGARQSLQDAAAANLLATTGLVPQYLEQLYAFGGLDRSPSRRVVSIVYWALVRGDGPAPGGAGPGGALREDPNVAWYRAEDPAVLADLAFDHRQIVEYALWRLRNKVEYGSIAHRLLGERFTLAQVREVYEAVLGRALDPANFRRQLRGTPDIEATDEFLQGGKHRPPRLYRYTGDTTPAATGPPLPQHPAQAAPPRQASHPEHHPALHETDTP
ncbi:ADP-ribose pyrophosphatase [Zafaria cholistanensis]|uniref:ADP-ribose pyrophosphatase n=1 Tax=Zafaria cholistanensis TaxID=1682741 RepID=A0A5A7NMY1_9MICC|nr:NUDIX domain-containing protein [Zafaria cholistanensis]GER21856.1 ADP-ribose pyrophosphatase [Zafaria cholistanensis]